MLFSIIIPVYNVADYLRGCVDSVLANDCSDCEIILVDDGATDGVCPALCDTIAACHPDLIRVIHQENRGLGGARNSAIEVARGDYLLFVDSDDTIVPTCLTVLRQAVIDYQPEVVEFHLDRVSEETGEIIPSSPYHSLPIGKVVSIREYPRMLMDQPASCSRLWKRTLFTNSGIRFPDRLWYEDLHTTGKLLLLAERVVGLDAHLYRYLIRAGSIMNNHNVSRNGEIIVALDALTSWYRERGVYTDYEQEFCGLALHHICYACARVLRQDPDHAVMREFAAYVKANFPNHKACKYYKTLTSQQRLILALVLHGKFRLAAGMFKLNDMLRRR